jgi:hypothetical protein
MVDVTVLENSVAFKVEGVRQLWAFRSELVIPLADILGVEFNPARVGRWWQGVRLMESNVPGLFADGTFVYHGELVFWDVEHPEHTIVLSLVHERYKKFIIEVPDPEATAAAIRDALDHGTA